MDISYIDINSDVGEGLENESLLFPFISSCSIACGGHAGDGRTMLRTVQLAKQNGVRVGAHPSYPDRENFGRESLDISGEDLSFTVRQQIEDLLEVTRKMKVELHHIKFHGALYNDAAKSHFLAKVLCKALEKYKPLAHLYVPFESAMAKEAHNQGFSIKFEAFGDRSYRSNLSLVPRNTPNALIQEPSKVLEQVVSIVKKRKVKPANGVPVKILADTICIHGDTPNVLQIVSYLSKKLPNYDIQIQK